MTSSQALIPWEPVANNGVITIPETSRPEGGRWALFLNAFLSPSPGRTLNHVYSAAGKVLETQANQVAYKLGLGPHVIAGKIKLHFGDGEHRMHQLQLLRTTIPPKLKKQCRKLMKYTLPTESANTQCQAFKEIIDLATLLPGLRVLFLQTKMLANVTSLDTISALWDRSTGPPDKEWTFWQALAATCLADTVISAMTEESPLADLVACHNEGLSIIEQLLVEHDCGVSKYTSALCLRYLAGVLNLPGFWQNLGCAHAQVAHKLCCRMVQVLKDIGVDISSLGLIEEDPVDYDGVDLLATTLLSGLSSWFDRLDREDWTRQPWYGSFTQVLQLLREPRAAELLPWSSASATSTFEDVLPTTYQDRVLNVMVENQNTVPGEQAIPAGNQSTDNLSTHSVQSDISQESSQQGIEPLHDPQSQPPTPDPEGMPPEQNTADENPDPPEEDDIVSDNNGCEEQFGTALEHDSDVRGDSSNRATSIPDISGAQHLPASTSWPSPEAQRKDLKEQKLILLNKQRDLGENHPETLDAMESLAWLYHQLGDFRSERDVRVKVLEKYQILQGEDGPRTLQAMEPLGRTYIALGQGKEAQEMLELALNKQRKVLGENHPVTAKTLSASALAYQCLGELNKAQKFAMSALEKYSQLLGEDHPETLGSMHTLAAIYRQLGQGIQAEDLYHIVVEKRISILGENHPTTLGAMTGLGRTCLFSGQLKKAENLLTIAFDKQKKVLGEEHPDTLNTMGTLATTYKQLGQLSAAEELATVALVKHQKVYGRNHPATTWIMGQLALIFHDQGQLEPAEELLVALLEQRRKFLGDDHLDTRWTIEELANLYKSMGKL
ncbi:hypothetical protein DFH08DRAFT_332008 [Mycena albidolilacea]|uniref:Kinesin light chain n=1 Tax=Mycena albidolilacea TaxID=1033008 RepID=A0AAD6ZLD9_9AGAR|nr:hypothetical protein DFH08DRAFT_332008 [Mycena albidolilacea]